MGDAASNLMHATGTIVNGVIGGFVEGLQTAGNALNSVLNPLFGPGGNEKDPNDYSRTAWTDTSGQTHWGSENDKSRAEQAGTVAKGDSGTSKSQIEQDSYSDRKSGSGTKSGSETQNKDGSKGTMSQSKPILLDLNANGVEIAGVDRSTTFLDTAGDGLDHRTAWAGVGDGVLFYDVGGDGQITEKREFVFTEWDPTAKDDMAALRARFDTNDDGKLSGAELDNFKVMVTNADGSRTATTLTELGITSINLQTDTTQIGFEGGPVSGGQRERLAWAA